MSKQELENKVKLLEAKLELLHSALLGVNDLLTFFKENFGPTADYPVRIDKDYYEEIFLFELEKACRHLEPLSQ